MPANRNHLVESNNFGVELDAPEPGNEIDWDGARKCIEAYNLFMSGEAKGASISVHCHNGDVIDSHSGTAPDPALVRTAISKMMRSLEAASFVR